MITVRVDSEKAKADLAAISRLVARPADMLAESATRVERALRGHFADRDRVGNKLGGRRTNFWAAIANSTAIGTVTDTKAVIEIGDPRFAQKVFGGTITAKTPWSGSGFKLLTIPVHAAAHGRRASVLARELGVKLTFIGNAAGGVIGRFARKVAEGSESNETIIYYACVPSVTQAPDPNALPAEGILEDEALKGAQDYLATETGQIQSE